MSPEEIEKTIEECKEMASEPIFNLNSGHTKMVNLERYVDLLEELLRGALRHIKRIHE